MFAGQKAYIKQFFFRDTLYSVTSYLSLYERAQHKRKIPHQDLWDHGGCVHFSLNYYNNFIKLTKNLSMALQYAAMVTTYTLILEKGFQIIIIS